MLLMPQMFVVVASFKRAIYISNRLIAKKHVIIKKYQLQIFPYLLYVYIHLHTHTMREREREIHLNTFTLFTHATLFVTPY